ncbi:MAG: hydrolase [Moraxellaceae bacterium]
MQEFPRGLYASPFRPAWWLRNPHAQTLFSTLFRRPPALSRRRETLSLPDGDFLDLDWLTPPGWQPETPLVVVVHGLSGSSESHYVLGLQAALAARGWASIGLNCRGASRPNHLPRAYHAGASDDLAAVLAALRARHPETPLALVGYSLGGNMTLKLMGETGQAAPVFAAVAVSVPLLLPVCADRLDQGFSRVYRQHFMAELTAQWEARMRHLEARGDPAAAERVRAHLRQGPFRSFWHYDDAVMAPLHGFADVHDYYRRASSRPFLRQITRPTLVIQSADDPFMTPGVLPDAAELGPGVHFELCRAGGHVGFIEGGSPRAPRYYLERRIPAFLQAVQQAIQGADELLG